MVEAIAESKKITRQIAQGNIGMSEPLFTLRGRDPLAAETVRDWARRANDAGVSKTKVAEAILLADEMDAWEPKKLPD